MNQFKFKQFKRWLAGLSFIVGIPMSGYAESVEIDALYYELNAADRSATVTSYDATSLPANVVIPSDVTYNGNSYKVTTIGRSAFQNCSVIESVSIPGSVLSVVNDDATSSHIRPFENCSRLKIVRFEDGDSPIQLGSLIHGYFTISSNQRYEGFTSLAMFRGCPLEEVYIGRNINYGNDCLEKPFKEYASSYDYSPFYNQEKLAKVTIGTAVTEIPDYLFFGNSAVTLIKLPQVKNIGQGAFEGCIKLTTLDLGTSLETFGDRAFYECSNITKLTCPNSVISIGNGTFYNCTSITEVTVGTGLREIGSSAFKGCVSFTAVILPNEFESMGESAFEGCTKLTVANIGTSLNAVPAKAFKDCPALSEMVVPASVKSIGDQAFYNDSGLATITMNEGLKTIGSEVFWNNSGIMRFQIPGTVVSIGSNSFYGCTRVTYLIFQDGTEELTLDNRDSKTSKSINSDVKYDYFFDCPIRFLTLGRNLKYSYDDELITLNTETLTFETRASAPFVNHKDLRSVTIGKNVTFLWHHLFNGCSNVSKIVMSDGLKEVYTYALANCTALTELIFPNPLVLLDNYVCANDTQLATVVFNEEPDNILEFTIGEYAFRNCPSLTSLTFPAKTVSIGNYCFYETPNLKNISFVDSKKAISLGYGAKADAYQGITKDANMPLFGNSRLNTLYIGRNISYLTNSSAYKEEERGVYGFSPFYNQSFLTDVKFSQAGTVTYCHHHLLYKVNNCEEIILPESLQTIGDYTFAGMTLLNGITIPNKVTGVGKYAFAEDENLKYATLSTSCPWLKEGLFSNCRTLASITIPPVVTKMDRLMFNACESLETATFEGSSELIEMGYGATNINHGLFRDCPLITLNLDRWLSYDTGAPERSPFYSIAELKNLNLGENVKVVDKYMFSYCTGLEEVLLPDHMESVGLWGFRGCSALKNVHLSANLSQVSDYGFAECTSLDNVIFPAKMTSVADHSFADCTSLKKLDLGNSLNIIGPAAFKNDTQLESIVIPETLYGLGVEAFANCTSLPNVTIRAISSVGKQAFQGCSGLKWVSLSDKTTSLGEDSFADCPGINYVKSYAEFPPEGLVNFVESVPANGTLFVPEASIDYYQYSPTWETWGNIRPLNDNVMVTSVTLDKEEISFKATEKIQLIATVGADDATDKGIIWRTDDENVATVDETGLVTAVAVGESTVTALAADGSGEKAVCQITVVPTMVESIAISGDLTTIKKGRTLELAAAVAPATATNSALTWSTSDATVATVDKEGIVTAFLAGTVTITAAAEDGSGIAGTYTLTVIPPTKGDSNDNDDLTITDAVNTANYAVGNEVENFCTEAADVNEDGVVTLADASGTVTLLLDQPVARAVLKRMGSAERGLSAEMDCLVVDDYSIMQGKTTKIGVALDNSRDYVAMQADITLPEGMTLVTVESGTRADASHSLMFRRIDDRTVRVVLFDLGNSVFADNNEDLFKLTVKADNSDCGNIHVDNIIASDANAHEYLLTSTGGNNTGTSGVDEITDGTIRIVAGEGNVDIINANGLEVAIYAVDGTLVDRFTAVSTHENRRLTAGIYVIAAGTLTEKVMVK